MKYYIEQFLWLCSENVETISMLQRARRMIDEHHIDVKTVVDEEGNSPLIRAARKGHTGLCKLLLKEGADIHAAGEFGSRPLYVAAYRDHVDTCRLLLREGADAHCSNRINTAKPIDFPACKEALAQIEKERSQPVPVAPPAPPADEPSASEAQRAEKLQAAKHKLAKYMRNEAELGRTQGRE